MDREDLAKEVMLEVNEILERYDLATHEKLGILETVKLINFKISIED